MAKGSADNVEVVVQVSSQRAAARPMGVGVTKKDNPPKSVLTTNYLALGLKVVLRCSNVDENQQQN